MAKAQGLSQSLRRWLTVRLHHHYPPLQTAAELRQLAQQAAQLPWPLLSFQYASAHHLMGESLSIYRGRGFEFDDNRPYQAGDEPRLLNWRLYARSCMLHTKVFTEERRPQLYLVVDRRAAMRFATRKQLKVTLAVRIALCYLYQAQSLGLAVGGYVLNQEEKWFAPAQGDVLMRGLLNEMVAPCAPLPLTEDTMGLQAVLGRMMHQLPAGSFILVLSDFHDLDAESAAPVLHHLAGRHDLKLVQILDPVERNLPAQGDFLIDDALSSQTVRIDGRDSGQRRRYRELFQQRQLLLQACCKRAGVSLSTCSTADSLLQCLETVHA